MDKALHIEESKVNENKQKLEAFKKIHGGSINVLDKEKNSGMQVLKGMN
ncbi:MAG: hypothetical protein IPH89_03915 [Bacteroidetes bacterium]|nr:hypothetical protein [Bacteroidota bacterium]